MSAPTIRKGTRRKRTPVEGYNALLESPYRVGKDDGKRIFHAGDITPVCGDCGVGHLQWAEAGYVAWHRICDTCGSHWDLHPRMFYLRQVAAAEPANLPPSLREQRWEIDLEPGKVKGVGDPEVWDEELIKLVTPEIIAEAVERRNGGVPTVATCWASRAHFY